MSESLFGNTYQTDFDPVSYLKAFYTNVGSKLSTFHQIVEDLPNNMDTLLDLGCGPCIDSIISLSSKCSKIFMAEYSIANRRELEKWLSSEPGAHDWSPFFRFVAEKEGLENWRDIEKRIKQKIQLPILIFDFEKSDVLARELDGNDRIPINFDMVVTSLCLEAATATLDDYESALTKVANLIKPRGYFLMYGILGETFYSFDDKRFFCLKLNEDQVKKALKKNGFEIQQWLFCQRSDVTDTEKLIDDFSGKFADLCRQK